MWVCRCWHSGDCLDHGWSWANPFRTEQESHENHLLCFEPPLGWVQLEFHLLHSLQEMVEILIMISLGLLLCLSTAINKNIISNVADTFQSCKGFLLSRLILRRAVEATGTCQKEYGMLWPGSIRDLEVCL